MHITELFAPDEPLRVLSTVEKGQHRESDSKGIGDLKQDLRSKFEIKDLGSYYMNIAFFLGIEIARSKKEGNCHESKEICS